MPLVSEHLRADPKSHPNNHVWEQVEHNWTLELLISMSALIEEDGGPPRAFGSGYGDLAERMEVDHTFTNDYPLPNDEPPIKKGDRICMWREGIGIRRRKGT